MQIQEVAVARLFCSPNNPRKNDDAVEHVAASIRKFGWQQPIVARPTGEVIVGNTRLKAALKMGAQTVPVHWFEGSDTAAAALMIADNRTHEFSQWDEGALATMLADLRQQDALEGIGYSETDVRDMVRRAEAEAARIAGKTEDEGAVDPPTVAVTQLGDLWDMHGHRIICGDSTLPSTYDRLLGRDERPSLLSTDPPYCVAYDGNARVDGGTDWGDLADWDDQDLRKLLRGVLSNVLARCIPALPIYIWHAARRAHDVVAVLQEMNILPHQQIIWNKPASNFGTSLYRWRHEPCFFGWPKGNRPKFTPQMPDTVWDADWDGKKRACGPHHDHPTEKPTRLFEIPMEVHTQPGDIVLEPFSGSGSQLIAANKLGRVFRGVDLKPTFVDSAVRRWIRATGGKAMLVGGSPEDDFWTVAKKRGVEVSS